MQDKTFYNYVYLDPRKPGDYNYGKYHFKYEPFYVGKGINFRCNTHLNETKENTHNPKKFNKINKIRNEFGTEPIILILFKNLDEHEAFNNEKDLISIIGRHDLKLGPLTNLTNGGEGGVGYKHTEEDNFKNIQTRIIQIYQYDLELNLINVWDSIANASRFYNIKDSNIILCLKGKLKTCNKFHWSYHELSDDEKSIIKPTLIKEPWNKGRIVPEEELILMSERMKGDKNPNYNKSRSEETKYKIKQSMLSRKNDKSKVTSLF